MMRKTEIQISTNWLTCPYKEILPNMENMLQLYMEIFTKDGTMSQPCIKVLFYVFV